MKINGALGAPCHCRQRRREQACILNVICLLFLPLTVHTDRYQHEGQHGLVMSS